MSIRYGISVIPEPRFTARAYRARQLVCGQYASWAAEMHPIHLPLIDYFPCPEELAPSVDAGLEEVAREFVRHNWSAPLSMSGAFAEDDHIFLDFGRERPALRYTHRQVYELRKNVIQMLRQLDGLTLDPEPDLENWLIRIALMQHANLSPRVFQTALTFAQGIIRDLLVPGFATAWQLVLIRFESNAAGDAADWRAGKWAADLRWQLVSSYPLRNER